MSLHGGMLIGLSVVMVMALFGRIAGIAGITYGVLGTDAPVKGVATDWGWRLAVLLGFVAAPFAVVVVGGDVAQTVSDNLPSVESAGLLVGLSTALGSGCTPGHGVCGLTRLSSRSVKAVGTLMAAAGVTVLLLRHVFGA
ncbi:YeeE/YedE family protein [Cereibacter sphaeroides]|uniref:YeeE/YedE family protein n=1 Tax=Cereibacter sphaeroides TaxID=1063 RepID=UPI00313C9CEA